jgi:hypothetical protein
VLVMSLVAKAAPSVFVTQVLCCQYHLR